MKPKEALVKDGFLPPGSENTRGRLSADAIERCKVLVTQGWDIEGYSMSHAPVQMESAGAMAAQVSKVKVDPNRLVDVPDIRRPEDSWSAWVGTQSIGMRTVCNNCRCSLTYCPCEQPRVWLDHETQGVVYFKPVKA